MAPFAPLEVPFGYLLPSPEHDLGGYGGQMAPFAPRGCLQWVLLPPKRAFWGLDDAAIDPKGGLPPCLTPPGKVLPPLLAQNPTLLPPSPPFWAPTPPF